MYLSIKRYTSSFLQDFRGSTIDVEQIDTSGQVLEGECGTVVDRRETDGQAFAVFCKELDIGGLDCGVKDDLLTVLLERSIVLGVLDGIICFGVGEAQHLLGIIGELCHG